MSVIANRRRLIDYSWLAYKRAADRAFEEHTKLTLTAPVTALDSVVRSYSDKRARLWAAYQRRKSAFELRAFLGSRGISVSAASRATLEQLRTEHMGEAVAA